MTKKGSSIGTAVEVRTRPPGVYGVRNCLGLYLVVNEPTGSNPKGSRQWQYRFTSPVSRSSSGKPKRREMGLGSAGTGGLTLEAARDKANEFRRQVRAGADPLEAQRAERAQARAEGKSSAPKTFGEFADSWIDQNEGQFRNAKHVAQWRMTLKKYAKSLRSKPLDQISTEQVLEALKPIWQDKPETAKRTQGRIERILDAAKAAELRSGDNPARWRGHLKLLLPSRKKLPLGHHAALPYEDFPAFMAQLRQRKGIAAQALEFLILVAARSGEVRGMTWAEVDLTEKRWTIPAARMKAGKEHRVPLTDRAIEILKQAAVEGDREGFVFPGAKQGKPMSDMTLAAVLKRMKHGHITVHGFRSVFRDWAEDRAGFPFGTIKAALAHAIGDKVDAAYRRRDAYDLRVKLMETWASYAASSEAGSEVIDLAAMRNAKLSTG